MKSYNLKEEIQHRIKNIEPKLLEKIVNRFPCNGFGYQCNIKNTIYDIRKLLLSNVNYKPHSIEYWVNRGWSNIDAERLRLKRNKEWYVSTYGNIEGNKKWDQYTRANEIKSQKQIKRIDRKKVQLNKTQGKFKNTLSDYIHIYGKKIGKIKYKLFCKKSSHPNPQKGIKMTLDNYIDKYGKILGHAKYLKRIKTSGTASNGSLRLFLPLIEMLDNIQKTDILIGYNGQLEKRIFYNGGKNWYWYDFTIENKKKIIEYNGLRYHTDKERDLHKIKIAEESGYEVLSLWSSTELNTNIELALKFIYNE